MLKMLHIWMLPHVVYGVVKIRRFSWMLRILLFKDFSISSNWRKQRKYEKRVCEVEMGCFTPLVFSTSGRMSTICKFFKRLAFLLADMKDVANSVMSWIHCCILCH